MNMNINLNNFNINKTTVMFSMTRLGKCMKFNESLNYMPNIPRGTIVGHDDTPIRDKSMNESPKMLR